MEDFKLYDEEFDVDLSDLDVTDDEAFDDAEEELGVESAAEEGDDASAAEEEIEEEGAEAEEDDDGSSDGSDGKAPPAEGFTLKWMSDTRTVSREEVIQLAQKGMDYDRVKTQRDEYKARADEAEKFRKENAQLVEELNALMAESGQKNASDFFDAIRVEKLAKNGVGRDVAVEKVARQRAERQLSERMKESKKANEKQAALKKDLDDFRKAYPNVELSKKLLSDLSEDLKTTGNLSLAYARFENRRLLEENRKLQAKKAADDKNRSNRKRSAGSQKSAGEGKKNDAFLETLLSD